MKIALFGLFGIGNFGNDASLEAMLDFLRRARPDAVLTCICERPDIIENKFSIPCVPIHAAAPTGRRFQILNRLFLRVPRLLGLAFESSKRTREFDLLFIPGTGILGDLMNRPHRTPLALLMWCIAARLRGVKIIFVSIGAGPIENPISRLLMVSAAKLAHYRSYRDQESKDFMRSMRVDVYNDSIFPDIVFGLPEDRSVDGVHQGKALTIGIGIMNYRGWWHEDEKLYDDYQKKMEHFAAWCLSVGHNVRILQCDVYDKVAVDRLLQAVRKRKREGGQEILFDEAADIHDLMRQIDQTDAVVATRFHTVVCALKLATPVISVGYGSKNDELMKSMGMGDFCQDIQCFDLEKLLSQFGELIAKRTSIRERVVEKNLSLRAQLSKQEAMLTSRFLE